MGRVIIRKVQPSPENNPEWLLAINQRLLRVTEKLVLSGTLKNFQDIKSFFDAEIQSEYYRHNIRADVATQIVTDEGRTVIHVFRNKKIIESIFIE